MRISMIFAIVVFLFSSGVSNGQTSWVPYDGENVPRNAVWTSPIVAAPHPICRMNGFANGWVGWLDHDGEFGEAGICYTAGRDDERPTWDQDSENLDGGGYEILVFDGVSQAEHAQTLERYGIINEERNNLRTQLDNVQPELDQLRVERDDLRMDLDNLQPELDQLRVERDDLRMELDPLRNGLNEIRGVIESLNPAP